MCPTESLKMKSRMCPFAHQFNKDTDTPRASMSVSSSSASLTDHYHYEMMHVEPT